jgi:hypothetical protein
MAIWNCFGSHVFRGLDQGSEMRLNRTLMGGLAWVGVVGLFAVPSAEFLSAQFDVTPALAVTSDMAQVQVASLTGDPVDKFLSTGKPLPSYLSGAPDAVTQPATVPAPKPELAAPKPAAVMAPAPVKTTPLVTPEPGTENWAPVQTASIHQPGVVPVPMPASMRPATPAGYEPVLILDEAEVFAREAALNEPLADIPEPVLNQPRAIESDELEDWDSGSLAEFLARRGLLDEDTTTSRAIVTENGESYDVDGFFLDEGPNNNRRSRRNRDLVPPGDIEGDGDYFVVFPAYR